MRKILVAGATALAIASTSLAYAQQASRGEGQQRWQPSADNLRAFGEARLAALKAGLMLTPDQARNWPAFEQAAPDFAKQPIEPEWLYAMQGRLMIRSNGCVDAQPPCQKPERR